MMKLSINDVRVDQTSRFYRQGSVLGNTATSGSLGIDVVVDVESPEPPEKISRLIQVAKSSCYTHGALASPVTVETTVQLNGHSLEAKAAT